MWQGFIAPHPVARAGEVLQNVPDPDMPAAPNQHLPVDVPDIAVSEIFTSKFMPEALGVAPATSVRV